MELNSSYLYSFLSKRGFSPHFIDKEIIQFRIENFTSFSLIVFSQTSNHANEKIYLSKSAVISKN